MGGRSRTGLFLIACLTAACSADTQTAPATPAPTVASPRAAPTTTPAPATTASPSPSPGAASSATPDVGRAVIGRFLDIFATAKPPFHCVADITVSGGAIGEVSIEMDVSGEDYAGVVHLGSVDAPDDREVVFVDGVAYVRPAGGEWVISADYKPTQPPNPFSLLDPGDLAYVEAVTGNGLRLHQLQTTKWIGEEPSLPTVPDAHLTGTTFDVYVDDAGIPQAALLLFGISGTFEGDPLQIDYVVDYTFTNVGVPITIVVPDV